MRSPPVIGPSTVGTATDAPGCSTAVVVDTPDVVGAPVTGAPVVEEVAVLSSPLEHAANSNNVVVADRTSVRQCMASLSSCSGGVRLRPEGDRHVLGIGLVALFLAHGELFTEGFLLPVMALFAGRGTPLQLVRLWGVTLLTNLAGGWVFMWLVARAFPEFEEVLAESRSASRRRR